MSTLAPEFVELRAASADDAREFYFDLDRAGIPATAEWAGDFIIQIDTPEIVYVTPEWRLREWAWQNRG